jgi:hypothetical protein
VVACSEYGNGPKGSIKYGESLDQVRELQLGGIRRPGARDLYGGISRTSDCVTVPITHGLH